MGRIKTTAELEFIAGSTLSSTSTGSTTINSGTGGMNISTDASATTVSIATGAAVKGVTLGSTNSTSATTVRSGSGALNITSTNGALTINSGSGALGISTDASSTGVSIATGANTKTVIIGNAVTSSAVTITSGTGGSMSLDSSSGNLSLSAGSGNLTINTTNGPISIGSSGAKTIVIGNTTGATGIQMNTGTNGLTLASASGNLITQLSTGAMTRPLQPAFLAYLGSNDSNVTGNGAVYVLGTNVALTKVFDQGTNFNTNGTFTAPVSGVYMLAYSIRLSQLTTIMLTGSVQLTTSNANYVSSINPYAASTGPGNNISINFSTPVDMDAADTASISITVSGGAGNTADLTFNSTFREQFFSGYLVC